MAEHNEMTRHAFISHMQDYMKKLIKDPFKADTDEFLKSHGIDGPKALKILTMRTDPNDENSAIIIRKTSIKDNGVDEDGKRLKDSFTAKVKIPRKDYSKKMRNLYISLFERNIVDGCPINEDVLGEGAWGYGVLDNDAALDYQSTSTKAYLRKVMKDIMSEQDAQNAWAKIGVLVDFLKKYKDDEIQFSKEYEGAIQMAKSALKHLFNDEKFISAWDDESKIKSSLKKAFDDLTTLRYNDEIMNPGPKNEPLLNPVSKINEDGEGGGATTADASGQYTTPLFGGPIRKKTMYITSEQEDYIKKIISEEEGNCPVQDTRIGAFGYDAPIGDGKKNKNNDFYKEANNHKNIMKNSWPK